MFGLLTCKLVFKCKVWEDNDSCITVAKAPKFTPHTTTKSARDKVPVGFPLLNKDVDGTAQKVCWK